MNTRPRRPDSVSAPRHRRLSLDELSSFKKTIAQQGTQARHFARQEAQQAVPHPHDAAEDDLFRRTVGPVLPIKPQGRAVHERHRPRAQALQRQRDDAAVLREAWSDDIDIERLLETDDTLSFRRHGVPIQIVHQLRRGAWCLHAELDLHGLRTDEARERLGHFLRQARRHAWRCLRIVHGKGHGSVGRVPVLKAKVQRWLVQKEEVMAFVQARASQGGAGALIVLLRMD